jgi:hypothetical protein
MNSKNLKLNRSIVGRWATVKWDDIGRRDCIITEIVDDGKVTKRTGIRVFEPFEGIRRISADQITEIREYVKAQ